ncbi:hypothetical protein NQ318_008258 [Aromia moschata]|uniref:Caspase Dronc n=1 Tax=Aromia moschata TaxID=1265417 RepID=A0AAV8Y7J8_9CUCU|nr:hypothetical protein NQ318_008258 [Aromia moschata]
MLAPGISGCKPFRSIEAPRENIDSTERISIYENRRTTPLEIKVETSSEFHDTVAHNKAVHFYNSRSKKRGRLLIINNYDYKVDSKYRNGAIVDNENLHELFKQMGGWEIHHHNNKTAEEMRNIIKNFAEDSEGRHFDICCVIIMGHGSEMSNKTIIYGLDDDYIYANYVQEQFANDVCRAYRGKPKIFLFQVCRGSSLDHTIRHTTETDSIFRDTVDTVVMTNAEKLTANIRTQEDMLIGYATLDGYKAHRDKYRGSWYIELICEKFMKYAHNHSVEDLLSLVDQALRTRMSESETMQTAEHHVKGFKKLYLNPGIYYEDGDIKYYNKKRCRIIDILF